MDEIIQWLASKATPGAVGIWTLVIMGLVGWWRGLPAVLDAFANRQSKIEERMGKLLDDATTRFTRELAAADERHESCIKGQEKLIERIETLERERAEDRRQIADQQAIIDGMNHKMTQMQMSAIRTEGQTASPIIEAAIRSLDKLNEC